MRYDDRLKTVLKGPLPEGNTASLQWCQIVDLLAQNPERLTYDDIRSGFDRLHELHERVPEIERVSAIKALHGRLRSATLLVYLCNDSDPICDAAIHAADLTDGEWRDVIPRLPQQGRNSLQTRSDLGPLTRDAITRHASARVELPFLLSSANDDTPEDTPEDTQDDVSEADNIVSDPLAEKEIVDPDMGEISQISNLVTKIADYQRKREGKSPRSLVSDSELHDYLAETIDIIRFETDDSGTIIWAEGPPKGAIVGVTIAEPTFDDGPGPDAYGAAAFRQRMPLENARMRLCGAAVIAGDWRITAIPYFGEETGRFRGYRGIMKRPNAAEDVAPDSVDVERREQLQQLIHELRTPLNAIMGFSEIIEQQIFGPASAEYRSLSHNITQEARRLLTGFEDLDIAAKIDAGQMESQSGLTDPDWLIQRLKQRLQSLTVSRGVDFNFSVAEPMLSFASDSDSVERIFTRLLSAAILGCENGEELKAELQTRFGSSPVNYLSLNRPSRIREISEENLLDPSYGIDGDISDAPLLGLGFSLRLVRNLVKSANGKLIITDDRIGLTLPAAETSEMADKETEYE
ncbi:HAMP domain-containing sensor histidine kinase [Parasphingorhabdus sp. JC815]|uniref:sensor histidine kinase n=1 Tax=Parasphingorhabdus sp. JC815 TaxID=3232140 RepID=UPI003457D7FF